MKCLLVVACIGWFAIEGEFSSNKTTATDILEKQVKQLLARMRKVEEYKTCNIMKKNATSPLFGRNITRYRDCHELFVDGYTQDGVYRIWLTHGYRWISVFCDMHTVGNFTVKRGWIIVQRRMDGKVNFGRGWKDYVEGFGLLNKEHWIGLNNLYDIVRQKQIGTDNESANLFYGMRYDLEDWDGYVGFGESTAIQFRSERHDFEVCRADAGAYTPGLFYPVSYIIRSQFVTYDHNKYRIATKCMSQQRGGWWHGNCRTPNLNGIYSTEKEEMTEEKIFLEEWRRVNPNNAAFRYVSIKIG